MSETIYEEVKDNTTNVVVALNYLNNSKKQALIDSGQTVIVGVNQYKTEEIDKIDRKILTLIKNRQELSKKIGIIKNQLNIDIIDTVS